MANDASYNTAAMYNGIMFPYSPNSVDFSYTLNKISFNTIVGRVIQLISIKVNTITWEGDASSRENLLQLYKTFKQTQDQQIETEGSGGGASLLIMPTPIGSNLGVNQISMYVWARSMQIGWNYQSVTYPYRIQFELDEGFQNVTSGFTNSEIDQLVNNSIGVDIANSVYTGLVNNANLPVSTNLGTAVNQVVANSGGNDNLLNPNSSSGSL